MSDLSLVQLKFLATYLHVVPNPKIFKGKKKKEIDYNNRVTAEYEAYLEKKAEADALLAEIAASLETSRQLQRSSPKDGLTDAAKLFFELALRLDATNQAARAGVEKAHAALNAVGLQITIPRTQLVADGRGGGTTTLGNDHRCTTCTQGSSASVALTSTYPLGPGAQIGQSGFHGRDFTSFHTYVLLHDSDDTERQGLAVKRMYRTLAPQITENPTFMHLTKTTPAGIRAVRGKQKVASGALSGTAALKRLGAPGTQRCRRLRSTARWTW